MKRWMAALLCALLLMTPLTGLAEEGVPGTDASDTTVDPTLGDTTTVGEQPTAPIPPETTTAPTEDTTTEPTATSTTESQLMSTSMTVTYADLVVTVRVVDERNRPVRMAPLSIMVDGTLYSAQADAAGVATVQLSAVPQAVSASMSAFQGTIYYYQAAHAQAVIAPMSTTTGSTTAASTTAVPTAAPTTAAATTTTTTRYTIYDAPTRTLTTTDPALGDVTQIVTAAVTTTQAEPEPTASAQLPFPSGLALGLIIFGAVLLAAAIFLVVFFLVRKPRELMEDEVLDEEATEDELTETNEEISSADETPEEEEADEEEDAEESASESGDEGHISLEDLFRDRGE